MAAGTRNYGPGAGSSIEQFKQAFFDSDAILKLMDKATRKALSKFGSFVRRRAQTSIRYRNKPSAPGSPPSGHRSMMRTKTNKRTGVTKRQSVSPLREFIFFAYDPAEKAVIIGPAKTGDGASQRAGKPVKGTIPETLEKGGQISILELLRTPNRRERMRERPTRRKTVTVRARMYMGPAFDAELPQAAAFFHNSF